MYGPQTDSVSARLAKHIRSEIDRAAGWIGFDRFMELALYAPGLGYYSNDSRQFGVLPSTGSDFVTAPELTPLFGRVLASQVAQALQASDTAEVYEFGAGSGALASQLLGALGQSLQRYTIIDVSGTLRAQQRERLGEFGERVRWIDRWPDSMQGVVVGNEVLDAMPVKLLHWDGQMWLERGVVAAKDGTALAWEDRATLLRPPIEVNAASHFVAHTTVEIHPQAEAFVSTLGEHLQRGVALFIDYGFPEAEYYHPQRIGGTLMCHRAHRADSDPLSELGHKDLTAHVNFTGIALTGQNAGFEVIGYTSLARFLANCGLFDALRGADARTLNAAQMLTTEHEMGELFKVIGFAKGCSFDAIGFRDGDRTHRL